MCGFLLGNRLFVISFCNALRGAVGNVRNSWQVRRSTLCLAKNSYFLWIEDLFAEHRYINIVSGVEVFDGNVKH